MVSAPKKPLTLDAFLTLPETNPASEFVAGDVWQKPMPQGKHSCIQTELAASINAQLKPQRIARAFAELRCTFGDRSIVPDIAVFTWARIARDENGEVANAFATPPDWTIEILSPGQSQTKVTKNILYCLERGTEMGWLVDPEEKTILIYRGDRAPLALDLPKTLLPTPNFATHVALSVGNVFTWLKE
ncbi:MAG: Uma2 family endonuclease [Cyanobacteria bacterium J06639_1]